MGQKDCRTVGRNMSDALKKGVNMLSVSKKRHIGQFETTTYTEPEVFLYSVTAEDMIVAFMHLRRFNDDQLSQLLTDANYHQKRFFPGLNRTHSDGQDFSVPLASKVLVSPRTAANEDAVEVTPLEENVLVKSLGNLQPSLIKTKKELSHEPASFDTSGKMIARTNMAIQTDPQSVKTIHHHSDVAHLSISTSSQMDMATQTEPYPVQTTMQSLQTEVSAIDVVNVVGPPATPFGDLHHDELETQETQPPPSTTGELLHGDGPTDKLRDEFCRVSTSFKQMHARLQYLESAIGFHTFHNETSYTHPQSSSTSTALNF